VELQRIDDELDVPGEVEITMITEKNSSPRTRNSASREYRA
jgi:hypothetical protein